MGLIRKFVDMFDPPMETRNKDISWDFLSSMSPTSSFMTGHLAENLSTVLACVNAISTAIASLPAEVQQKRPGGGWETSENHSLSFLIRDGANDHQSWPDYLEWKLASTLLTGNGLSEKIVDSSGMIRELRPIPWSGVSVQQLPNGRLVYDVTDSTLLSGSGRPRRLLEDEVLHLKDRSDTGLIGRSRLHRAGGVIRPALALQQFTNSLWDNGTFPSGAVELDAKISDEARKDLSNNLREAFSGASNAAKCLILDQGLRWKGISVSPEDAEILMSRRFTCEELARLFNVPPPVIGDLSHGSFTNSETMLRWFAMGTLTPWIAKLEHEFHRSVFTAAERRSYRLDLDLSGLLRGDPETRWQSHRIAVEANILTVDEIREVEGWPKRRETIPSVG